MSLYDRILCLIQTKKTFEQDSKNVSGRYTRNLGIEKIKILLQLIVKDIIIFLQILFFFCHEVNSVLHSLEYQVHKYPSINFSGTMRFGRVDVTEAQFTIILIHLISTVFGPDIWLSKVNILDHFSSSGIKIATPENVFTY